MCRYCLHILIYIYICTHTYFLHFIKLRDQRFSDRSPRSSMMEMEQEKVNVRKGLSADAASYRCSACHGDEDWVLGTPIRGRAKSRSLSASPALASTKEFRYEGLLQPARPLSLLPPSLSLPLSIRCLEHIQEFSHKNEGLFGDLSGRGTLAPVGLQSPAGFQLLPHQWAHMHLNMEVCSLWPCMARLTEGQMWPPGCWAGALRWACGCCDTCECCSGFWNSEHGVRWQLPE